MSTRDKKSKISKKTQNYKTFHWEIKPNTQTYMGFPIHQDYYDLNNIFSSCFECNSKTAGSQNYTQNYPDVCVSVKNINVESNTFDIYLINL